MYVVETSEGLRTLLHMVKSAGTSIHAGIINASTDINYKVHVNQRHASLNNMPDKYKDVEKFIVIRSPHSWYKSFYRFFLDVEGYMSFMLNDPKEPHDGYIYPISFDEFVKRSINLKDTLIKYPNKARVFRNMLRSQGNIHFITGYFTSDFNVSDPESMEQFDMSLYEWFWRGVGGDEAFAIPMDRLNFVEEVFDIEIPHVNATPDNKPQVTITPEIRELIKGTHSRFYDKMIEAYKLIDVDSDQRKTIYE